MKYLSFFAALLFSIAVSANTTTGEPPFVLKVEHQSLKKDGEHVLEFRAANTKSLIGYQFAIELSEELEFVEVIPGEIPDLSKNNFGTQKASEGLIFTNWFSGNQRVFVEDELIFSIKVNVKKVVSTADAVIINHQKMASEVYKLNGEHFGVELIFSKNTNSKTSEMMVFPNPAKDELSIHSSIAQGQPIELLSPAGTVLKTYKPKSYTLEVNKIDLLDISAGVYLIRWTNGDNVLQTEKILKL